MSSSTSTSSSTSPPSYFGSLMTDVLAGLAGGVTAVMVGQPLDTVKVKMQLQPNTYRNMWSCLTEIVRERGVRGLYAGTVPALASNCAENAVLFGTYGQCQKLVTTMIGSGANGENETDLNFALRSAAAGGIASIFTSSVLCPAELVKIRMQMTPGSLRENVKRIWITDGFRGLYRGYLATLARESVECSVFFGSYECARHAALKHLKSSSPPSPNNDEDDDHAAITAASAGLAAALTGLFVCPMDVIKSRVQKSTAAARAELGGYKLIWREIRVTGWRSLYHGLWPALAKSVPIASLLLFTVESTKSWIRKHSDDSP